MLSSFSELEEEGYTGISISNGAGMQNICVMSNGEALIKAASLRSGDWLDRMTSIATGLPDSVIQVEKEAGGFIIGVQSESSIHNALSTYYERLIEYNVKSLQAMLNRSNQLPKFKDPLTIVIAGGTSRAAGYIECFQKTLGRFPLPVEVKEVRAAKDPLRAVSRGCYIASQL